MKVKDLVGIGRTVKTVSDAVRGAVSTLYRPTAIRKEGRARAEVAAYRVEALAGAEVKAALIKQDGAAVLEERVRQRFIFEQSMQQRALDGISQKAIEYSKKQKGKKGREISEHWLYRLMINSKDVTDDEIQDIFAKLIVEQGSAGKKSISYMTLDALRLFEPRHAQYFKVFCQIYYLFGGVYFGLRDPDSGNWFGDDEFSELHELGMVQSQPVGGNRLKMRDLSIEISSRAKGDDFSSIFGEMSYLSNRGIELSEVLYPKVATQYWHSLRKNLKKSQYENTMSKFMSPDAQFRCFSDLLDVIADDETPFTIFVHPWDDPYDKAFPVLEFDGEWTIQPKPPAGFYVPPYLRRLEEELRGK
jgi:Protein of unknown function (DUF2806)